MKIIVPMAGMGKRMRPHTLTVPKPLIPVAGKPIVQWLVEDITKVCKEKVEEIAFILGDFGKEVEKQLVEIANKLGAKGSIHYQDKPLGTAHAILCAKEALDGKVIVAFADTLFVADFTIDESKDGIIWVNKIKDPRMFGVVKVNEKGVITELVEKPETFVSDLAIIGIYYFKDGEYLRKEMQYLVDNDIKDKGEYQLTNALENMKSKGTQFYTGKVTEWLDCGNKDATVNANCRMLAIKQNELVVPSDTIKENAIIIQPCYIGKNVKIKNSVVGPFASIGDNSKIENAVISNCIVQSGAFIKSSILENSMVGNFAEYIGTPEQLSIGDYSTHN
jgi:glucose-1-phosphate thymidylyltransferase